MPGFSGESSQTGGFSRKKSETCSAKQDGTITPERLYGQFQFSDIIFVLMRWNLTLTMVGVCYFFFTNSRCAFMNVSLNQ